METQNLNTQNAQERYNPNTKIGIIYKMAFIENKSIEEIINAVNQPRKVVTNQIGEIRRTLQKHNPSLILNRPQTQEETQTPQPITINAEIPQVINTPQTITQPQTTILNNSNQETQERPQETSDILNGNIPSMKYNLNQYIPSYVNYYPRKYFNGRNNKLSDQDLYLKVFLENVIRYDKQEKQQKTHELINIMIVGETATGKTTSIKYFCYKHKLPFYNCQMDSTTDPSILLGGYIPDGKGGLIWIDGILTKIVRNGGVFNFDEINTANPEILTALNEITSGLRQITLKEKNGEIVKAHKNFMCFCCLNPVSYGNGRSKIGFDLNRRFNLKLFFDYDPSTEKKFISNSNILELSKKLRIAQKNGEIETPTDPASLSGFESNISLLGFEIARDSFLNGYEDTEKQAIKKYIDLAFRETDTDQQTETAESEELI